MVAQSTVQRVRLLIGMIAGSSVAGGLYAAALRQPPVSWVVQIAIGATIGVVISSVITSIELLGEGRPIESPTRRLPLALSVLLRTLVYGVVIVASLLAVPWAYTGEWEGLFRSGIVRDVAFSFSATFVVVSLVSIIRLIGPGVLANLLTGRYHRPREEQRIVLFLDLVGSTGIAESIGNIRFHGLLSEVFSHLSDVVVDLGGEVHRYVGDALIATWPLGTPEDNARPIRCLFVCRDALERARPGLLARHGHAPDFRAGLHAGRLVAGEVGSFKREIALLGDTMNTVARIEEACRTTGRRWLVSKALLDCTAVPEGVRLEGIGRPALRGKSEGLELFALDPDVPESTGHGAGTVEAASHRGQQAAVRAN